MARNLRTGIANLTNELNRVRNNSTDALEREQLQKVLRVLFTLWEEVIRQNINQTTAKYRRALSAVDDAHAAARAALRDIHQTPDAIRAAVKAAKAIDRVVEVVSRVLRA